MIRKSDFFFCKIHRHVRHNLILKCTLMSSIEKNHQHFEKVFKKNLIYPTCDNGQIHMLMYYGETKKILFKISKILPTSNPFLKIEIHIELTYRWNPYFFTKNDKISLDSPIVEKSKFFSPPPPRRVLNLTFFFEKRRLSMVNIF